MTNSQVSSLSQLQSELTAAGDRVVMFTQPSFCVPCRKFKPHWEDSAALLSDVPYLTVDLDEVPDAVQEYGLKSVPTIRIYRDGEILATLKPASGFEFTDAVKAQLDAS